MQNLTNKDKTYVANTYNRFPVELVSGKGSYFYDTNGKKYIDVGSGIGVNAFGTGDEIWKSAVISQLDKLQHTSNLYYTEPCANLAELLCQKTGMKKVFFGNSGAEANENALKLASFHNGRTRVLSAEKAFHGRTSLAVEATANPKIIAPINANGHVTYLPLNDIEPWRAELEKGDVCAVIIECIQGVGGIRMVEADFLKALRDLCDKYDTVLVCDEIQCGYGRSGKFFAHQYLGVEPDMITVAKGIANGYPMSGLLISPKFTPVYGQLGTTFGGNHLGCAAALAVLDVIEEEGLVQNAAEVGEYLMERLRNENLPHVVDVRGRGLMIGIELDQPYKEIRTRLVKEQHCFTGCSGTNVIRLLPPLCMTKADADDFIERFKAALK